MSMQRLASRQLPIIAVVGPTASGKTRLSLALAEELGGEIVNTDAMAVYRGMDIGTAKADAAQRARVPHHLLDLLEVTEPLTVAEFQGWARTTIAELRPMPGHAGLSFGFTVRDATGDLDRLVNDANAKGLNVLFSVVKAPAWARPADDRSVDGPPANPQDFANFMAAVANRYQGKVQAYEIWNEQNLWYEWGGRDGRIDAARYMALLRAAYNAVKSNDPNAIVISGAPTPTGVNDGNTAVDDQAYLRAMYANGLRGVSDCIGVHPSGFNNPPNLDWTQGGDGDFKGHPSFFFRSTMEGYRNIMLQNGDGNKKLCPTEFGWASVQGLGAGPAAGYGYAAQISEGLQAQYITQAYQMARNWGWVGPMFLWNLNFAPVSGAADEKAAFGIVRPNWSHRAAFDALAGMSK